VGTTFLPLALSKGKGRKAAKEGPMWRKDFTAQESKKTDKPRTTSPRGLRGQLIEFKEVENDRAEPLSKQRSACAVQR